MLYWEVACQNLTVEKRMFHGQISSEENVSVEVCKAARVMFKHLPAITFKLF